MDELRAYINGLAAIGFQTAAAAMSSTILKKALIPLQIEWLGTAGTVVAACWIAVAFASRSFLLKPAIRIGLLVVLIANLGILVWLRASVVVRVSDQNYLVGFSLAEEGVRAQQQCQASTQVSLITCAGVDMIPYLYGVHYDYAQYAYIVDYLLLLVVFVSLIYSIDLREKHAL